MKTAGKEIISAEVCSDKKKINVFFAYFLGTIITVKIIHESYQKSFSLA